MHVEHPAKDKLYRRFKGGDGGALLELLEGERAGLYDYLMRMTGQVSRSTDTIDEVYGALTEETLETIDSYAELKICVFTTARKFNADIWNANTAKLGNAAFAPDDLVSMALDKALRNLPGPEREAVCLKVRGGFEPGEVGEIMGLGEFEAETRLRTGLKRVEAEKTGLPAGGIEPALAKLAAHPPPPRSSQATMNLSMVMQGIQTKPVGLWSPSRLAFMVLVAAGLVVWIFWPEVPEHLWEMLHPPEHHHGSAP